MPPRPNPSEIKDDNLRVIKMLRRIRLDTLNKTKPFSREGNFLARRRMALGYTVGTEFIKITTMTTVQQLFHFERGHFDPRISKHFAGIRGLAVVLQLTQRELYWLICTDDLTPPPSQWDRRPMKSRPIPYTFSSEVQDGEAGE